MFAKLTTNNAVGSAFSSNVFYNTIIGVITGSITSNTDLDPVQFNRASSYITTVVPPGWSVEFPCANIGYTGVIPGCNAVMIKANWSDSNNGAKYITFQNVWGGSLAAGVIANTSIHMRATPHEGYTYNGATLTVSNTLYQIVTQANVTNLSTNLGTCFIPFQGPPTTGNGMVIIISASQAHLFIASYKNINGTDFNGYWYCTEYSRDDPWNTPGNGYPSWLIDCGANAALQGYESSTTSVHNGFLARVLETKTNRDVPWCSMWSFSGATNAAANWAITARDHRFGDGRLTNTGTGFQFPFLPRGLACASIGNYYTGNYALGRDINRNPSASMNELRVIGMHMDANINSNSVFAGGSINAVAPYVYAFRSQYNTLDQVVFNGNTYTHLILNRGGVGQTNSACYLIKEV